MAMRTPHLTEGTASRLRQLAAWTLILACWGALPGAASAGGGLVHAKNFQVDARLATQRRVPIMVLFSSSGCPYCDRVKSEYLVPMHQDPAYRSRVIFREVSIDSDSALTGFDGRPVTEAAFAVAHKVFMVPTVMVFDPRGKATGEAIVGLLIPDFYFGYLEAAIDEGGRQVRAR